MNPDSFMMLFDVIILCYGVYLVYSGYQMKKTHQPSSLIINQADLIGARDIGGFCEAMFKPVVVFGMLAVLYGVVGFINDCFWDEAMVNFISVALFLVLCFWFVQEMKKNKARYLK